MKRNGPFLLTYSGRRFWPLDPHAVDIALEDVAHALSMICRFGGHILPHYSVAEHSVRIAEALMKETGDPALACEGLFHDGAEAYTGDATWPYKTAMRAVAPQVKTELESPIDVVLRIRFGLAHTEPRIVKRFDLILLATEKRDLGCRAFYSDTQTDEWLMEHGYDSLADYRETREAVFAVKREQIGSFGDLGPIEPLSEQIVPWHAQLAEGRFMRMATTLLWMRTLPKDDEEVSPPAAYCTTCGRQLEPVRAVADGTPTLRGHHPCPDHPEAR